jgi:predicted nucleotidyltransferase
VIYLNTNYIQEGVKALRSALTTHAVLAPTLSDSVYTVQSVVNQHVDWLMEVSYKMLRKGLREMGFSGGTLQASLPQELVRLSAQSGLITIDVAQIWLDTISVRSDGRNDYSPGFESELLPKVYMFADIIQDLITQLDIKFGINSEFASLAQVRYEGAKYELQIPELYLRGVKSICRNEIPKLEVWAYGSRAFGNNHAASDLDLVAFVPGDLARTTDLSRVKEAFQKSAIPIQVQIFDWAKLPDSFKPEIEISHFVIQKAETAIKKETAKPFDPMENFEARG